MPHCKIAYIK